MRCSRWVGAVLILVVPAYGWTQRADDNAITGAEDAFGATLGDESIGLYSSSRVRGFSPVTAGNVRIEGLYFDRQAWLPAHDRHGRSICTARDQAARVLRTILGR